MSSEPRRKVPLNDQCDFCGLREIYNAKRKQHNEQCEITDIVVEEKKCLEQEIQKLEKEVDHYHTFWVERKHQAEKLIKEKKSLEAQLNLLVNEKKDLRILYDKIMSVSGSYVRCMLIQGAIACFFGQKQHISKENLSKLEGLKKEASV